MKKYIGLFILVILGGLLYASSGEMTADAAGHIGTNEVMSYLRTKYVRYLLWAPDTGANTNDATVGRSGLLIHELIGLGTGISASITSTIGGNPYPCKLLVYVKDQGNNSTLTCTGDIIICGQNQFGDPVNIRGAGSRANGTCETITTDLVEGTAVKSQRVYEKVTSFAVSGCSGAGPSTSDDYVVVACSMDIGLPFPISSAEGVINVCGWDDSVAEPASQFCWPYSAITEDIDVDDSSVQLTDGVTNTTGVGSSDLVGGTNLDLQFNDGDEVIIRVRAPAGR